MAIRHKKVYASLDTGRVDDWNDDHREDFDVELLSSWTFASTNLSDDFLVDVTGTADVDVAMVDNHNFCILATGATANSVGVLQLGDDDVTNKLDLSILTAALQLESSDLEEFGFFTEANTPFTANQKGAYFRVVAGELYAVTGDGVDETETDIGPISEYAQYKIEFTSTQVRFYQDDLDVILATHTTNIPSDDITIKFSIKNQTASNRIMRVDALALRRLRKQ